MPQQSTTKRRLGKSTPTQTTSPTHTMTGDARHSTPRGGSMVGETLAVLAFGTGLGIVALIVIVIVVVVILRVVL